MSGEVFHKVDLGLGNFSEIRQKIIDALGSTDFLHIKSLREELGGNISAGQLMCALDNMEREGVVGIRKSHKEIYVSLLW